MPSTCLRVSAEQYRRLRPYLELGERLGAFVAQAAPSTSFSHIRIRYAGEPAELGSHMIRRGDPYRPSQFGAR